MSDHTPQVSNSDDELSVDELDSAAGGVDQQDSFGSVEPANANACAGGNCGCG